MGSVMIASSGGFIALAGKVAPNRAKTTFHPLRPENTASPVTSGIHCFTLNSKYPDLLLLILRWDVYLSSGLVVLGPILLILYLGRFQIMPKERILAAKFGETFFEYTSRVRRWL